MQGQLYSCGLEAALDVVGGKWKVLILWGLTLGHVVSEFKRWVPGISEKMLIEQLREMEADGIMHRKVYPEVPPKVEYSLIVFGVSLNTALTSLFDWGNKHMKSIRAIQRPCASTAGKDRQATLSTTGLRQCSWKRYGQIDRF